MHRHTQCPDPDPMIGQTIHEFQIEKKLAEGGMGAVYLARHRLITSTAKVIKVLLPKFAQMPLLRQRFHREANAASKLQHDNILGIDNFGTLEDGQLFIMVPYLEGQPLDAYLRARGGRLAPHRALHLIVQLCDALMCAHGAGIIHRDLKPGNVFVVPTSSNPYKLKLLDFGIAKVGGSDGSPGTQSGIALGTPGYMAVEQYEYADEATHLADIYSLAVMTWEMVTGRLPWQHPEPFALYRLQQTSKPERPPVDIMPERWADTLLAAMSIEPHFRPQSARELALALASGLPSIGQVPSGAEIVASLAPHFMRQGDSCDETVRNCAEVERMVPLLWPPRETAPNAGAPKPPVAPIAASPVAAAPVLATTISAGAVGLSPGSERWPRHWRLALAGLCAFALAGMTTGGIAAWRSSRTVATASSAPAAAPVPTPTASSPVPTASSPVPTAAPPAGSSAPSVASKETAKALPPAAHPDRAEAEKTERKAYRAPPPSPAGGLHRQGSHSVRVERAAPMEATRPAPAGATSSAPPAPAAAAATASNAVGELMIHVEPWATVSVNGRSMGQTPYRAKLPAGSYRVRLQNDDVERDETITVMVAPGAPVTIRRTW